MKEKNRIQWLDVLRGLAILLVLLFHFTTRYGQKYPMNAFEDNVLMHISFGWIGVHLFFMISGFIIYLTIQNKQGPIDFLVARLSRLIPPYWTAIVLILILEFPHRALFNMSHKIDISTVFFNFIMVPDIFHATFLDGVFWSLYVEVKFYVLFALLWRLINLKKHSVYYISYGILLILASIHSFVYALPYGENLSYFLIFWTGIAACKVLYEEMPLLIYLVIAILTTVSTIGFYTEGLELIIGIPVFSFLFIAMATISSKYPGLSIYFKPFSALGRVSYSYYLIHQPIGYLALGILAGVAFNHNVSVLAAFILCLCVAWLGFRYIEQLNRPIASYIMSKIRNGLNQAKVEEIPAK